MSREEDMQEVIGRMKKVNASSELKKKSKLSTHDMAQQLITKYHIIRLNNSQLFMYDEEQGIYVDNSYERLNDFILKTFYFLTFNQCKEVKFKIQHTAPIVNKIAPPQYIAVNNGIINLLAEKIELQPHTPDIIITTKVNVDYIDPATISNNTEAIAFVDKFFNDISLNDTELITLLYEIICLCCYRSAEFEIAYIFQGARRKSVSQDIFK